MRRTVKNSYLTQKGVSIESIEYDANRAEKSKKVLTASDIQSGDPVLTAPIKSVKTVKDCTISEDKVFSYRCISTGVEWGLGAVDPKTKQEIVMKYLDNMSVGMNIKPDVMSQIGSDGKQARLTAKITNRKVVESANITGKGGNWKCTKLTYDF